MKQKVTLHKIHKTVTNIVYASHNWFIVLVYLHLISIKVDYTDRNGNFQFFIKIKSSDT